jgi:hypothetical protein
VAVDDDAAVSLIETRTFREIGHTLLIVEGESVGECLPGDGAIHGAGIDMGVGEGGGNRPRERPLSGAGGPVDRDDQAAPVRHAGSSR